MNIDVIQKNKKVAQIARWIKEYTHPLKAIGGLFFFLALGTGFFWALGKDIEPIAFIFALLSSIFFSSPSVAEYLCPSRKPIRHMNLDEILQFIRETNGKTDWKLIHSQNAHEAFLIEDMRLRIRIRWDAEDSQDKSFNEPWATKYPDPNASRDWYYLLYDGNLIETFILVSVDGCRALLPLPKFSTLEVDPLDYKIAQIFDQKNSLDEHMARSNLIVKNI